MKTFMQKTGYFLRSPGTIVSIALLIVISVLFIINKLRYDVSGDNYTSGLITEFIGIIVTVLFVQFLFDRKNTSDNKEQERKAIIRSSKIIQQYLKRYTLLYYCVPTPISDRNLENAIMPDEFTLKDMRDLHKMALSIRDSITRPSIDSFLDIELDIRNHMISMLSNINFKYYSDISSVLSSFVEASIAGDVRVPISDIANMHSGNEKTTDFIYKMLDESADDFYKELHSGEQHTANIILPYIILYEMMNVERELIKKYNEHIRRIGDF